VVAVASAGEKDEPPPGWDEENAKGNLPGIDKGWAYAPGMSLKGDLREIVSGKIAVEDAILGADYWQEVKPVMSESLRDAASEFVRHTAEAMQAKGESALVHVIQPEVIARMAALERPMETAGVWLTDDALLHAIRETKASLGTALPLSTWKNLSTLLDDAEVYLDTTDNRLLFVFSTATTPGGKLEKVVVAVDYIQKTRLAGSKEKRSAMLSNYIRTGGMVDASNIDELRYKRLR
jgi:hypothetical protein